MVLLGWRPRELWSRSSTTCWPSGVASRMRAIGAKRLPFSALDDKSSGAQREEITASLATRRSCRVAVVLRVAVARIHATAKASSRLPNKIALPTERDSELDGRAPDRTKAGPSREGELRRPVGRAIFRR